MGRKQHCLFCREEIILKKSNSINCIPSLLIPDLGTLCGSYLKIKFPPQQKQIYSSSEEESDDDDDGYWKLFKKLCPYFNGGSQQQEQNNYLKLCSRCSEKVNKVGRLREELEEIERKIEEEARQLRKIIVFGGGDGNTSKGRGDSSLEVNNAVRKRTGGGGHDEYWNVMKMFKMLISQSEREKKTFSTLVDDQSMRRRKTFKIVICKKEEEHVSEQNRYPVEEGIQEVNNGMEEEEYLNLFEINDGDEEEEEEDRNGNEDGEEDDDWSDSFRENVQRTINQRSSSLKTNSSGPPKNLPECQQCSLVFSSDSALSAHNQEFHLKPAPPRPASIIFPDDGGPIPCPLCPKKMFKNLTALENHNKIFHTSDDSKRFKCPHCAKAFVHNVTLRHHIEQIHEKIRYYCDLCPKSFTSDRILKDHRDLHVGGRPAVLICHLCQGEYSCKYSLKNHIKAVHQKPEPVTCDLCTRIFPNIFSLRAHQHRVHNLRKRTDPQGGDNNRQLNVTSMSKKPKVTGTSNQLIKCQMCDRLFANKTAVNRHVKKAHMNNQPEIIKIEGQDHQDEFFDDELPIIITEVVGGAGCETSDMSNQFI